MLLTLLALSTASAESPEAYFVKAYPDKIYGCGDTSWSGHVSLHNEFKQEDSFTIFIEDSGGWATPPTIGASGRAEFTVPAMTWEHLDLAGERLSAAASAWIDLAVSNDLGTSVRRIYFGPAVVIETELESREGYPLPDMASGSFRHESTFSCHSAAPEARASVTITVDGAVIDSISSNGAATEWLESATEATGVIECDGLAVTFETRGRLTEPKEDGWLGVTVEETASDPFSGRYTPGFCGADADYIPGYGSWPDVVEQMEDYELFEGYVLGEDESGELVLVPKELAPEEDAEAEEGSKKE